LPFVFKRDTLRLALNGFGLFPVALGGCFFFEAGPRNGKDRFPMARKNHHKFAKRQKELKKAKKKQAKLEKKLAKKEENQVPAEGAAADSEAAPLPEEPDGPSPQKIPPDSE
jgi:hypothetical protein